MRHSAARPDAVVLNAVEISGRSRRGPRSSTSTSGTTSRRCASYQRSSPTRSSRPIPDRPPPSGQRRRVRGQARRPGEGRGGDQSQVRRRRRRDHRAGAAVPARRVRPGQPHAGGLQPGYRGGNRRPAAGAESDARPVRRSRKVALLAYNEQTSGPETEKVLDAARQHGVAVVPVTETLPPGQDYLSWMTANVTAVDQALRP